MVVFGLVKSTPWHLNNPFCSMNGSCFSVVPDPLGVRCCMGFWKPWKPCGFSRWKHISSRCLLKNLYPLWRDCFNSTPGDVFQKVRANLPVMQVRRWVLDVLDPSLAYSLLQQCYIELFTVYFSMNIHGPWFRSRDWQPRISQGFGCEDP